MKVRDIEVGKLIGETSKLRIYLGSTDAKQSVILKVAKTFDDGHILAEEASKFNEMRAFKDEIFKLEEKQGKENSHYDWLFADLQASFMEPTQDDRRINVLSMPDIEIDKLTPLIKLSNGTEIDTWTSIWILGRFLKLYSFFELLAASMDCPVVEYPIFSPGDYLIGPKEHRLIYYNFSGKINDVVAMDFIKAITKFILDWVAIGDREEEQKYFNLLKDFSETGRDTCERAHRELYKLVEELWGIGYHPFVYRERGTSYWNVIREE